MRLSCDFLSLLKEASRWIKRKLDLLQVLLESKYPVIRELPHGKYLVHTMFILTIAFTLTILISVTLNSSSDATIQTSRQLPEVTLAGRDFTAFANEITRDMPPPVRVGRFRDVYDAIWVGFYGRNYRKNFYTGEIAKNDDGKPIIVVKERPWDGAEWSNESITVVNGVTTRKIDKNPDTVIFVDIPLILSVNDQVYQQWKTASQHLLQKFAVSKDEAVNGCWLAGKWFGLDITTAMALKQWKSRPEKFLQQIAKLRVWVEAVDTNGKVVSKNEKPLRECISLDNFVRKENYKASRFSLPLGARSDDIFELGRWSEFYSEDQASAQKKIIVDGNESFIEECYVSDSGNIALVEDVTNGTTATNTIFKVINYDVKEIVTGGIVAVNSQSKVPSIFLETPLQFAKGDPLPIGYARFISPSSKEGKSIRHFRQVLRKDPESGFHKQITPDHVSHEWASAWVRFDYLSKETAKSIASVRCWIEEEDSSKK